MKNNNNEKKNLDDELRSSKTSLRKPEDRIKIKDIGKNGIAFYNYRLNLAEITELCKIDAEKNYNPEHLETTYITLVGGAGIGKTTISSLLFAELKLLGKKADLIPEIVRDKIWMDKTSDLDNQYYISKKQYEKFLSRRGKVEYVVSDTSLINGLYYNNHNINNVCDTNKTLNSIMKWFHDFNNIVIYIKRGTHYNYDSAGRLHSFEESLRADEKLLEYLKRYSINYITLESSPDIKKEVEILAKTIINIIESNE